MPIASIINRAILNSYSTSSALSRLYNTSRWPYHQVVQVQKLIRISLSLDVRTGILYYATLLRPSETVKSSNAKIPSICQELS